MIDGQVAAHTGCMGTCAGQVFPPPHPPGVPTTMVVGAATVFINGKMAVRTESSGDVSACGAKVSEPAIPRTVLIGGPRAGDLINDGDGGRKAFFVVSASRYGGDGVLAPGPRQSFGNCGVEVSQQLIFRVHGITPTEEQILRRAREWWDVYPFSDEMMRARDTRVGSTLPAQQADLLRHYGVPAHLEAQSARQVARAVSSGRGVAVNVDMAVIWRSNGVSVPSLPQWHVLMVTGVQYDSSRTPTAFTITDTALGQVQQSVSSTVFGQAMAEFNEQHSSMPWMVVTDAPIWNP